MQEGLNIFDIVLLIGLAVFIFSRFSGFELPKDDKPKKKGGLKDAVVPFPAKEKNVTSSSKASPKKDEKEELQGVAALMAADSSFNEKEFLQGAASAYEMYYEAFNAGDEDMLDELTAPRVYDMAMEQLDEAESQGQEAKVDVKAIKATSLVDARIHGRSMVVDVKYEAEICEYTVDNEGKVAEGSKEDVRKVTSVWTWAKPVGNEDPNWELEAINAVS